MKASDTRNSDYWECALFAGWISAIQMIVGASLEDEVTDNLNKPNSTDLNPIINQIYLYIYIFVIIDNFKEIKSLVLCSLITFFSYFLN